MTDDDYICIEYDSHVPIHKRNARRKMLEKFVDESNKTSLVDYDVDIYRSRICGSPDDLKDFAVDVKWVGIDGLFDKILDELK